MILFSYSLSYVIRYETESPTKPNVVESSDTVPEIWYIGPLFSATIYGIGAIVFGLATFALFDSRKK